jgi:hypothetical protein
MRGIFQLLCLLLTMLMVSGCSRTALLYDNADWMAVRWVSSLLDPDSRQEERWQAMFGELVEQHREQLLPEVVTLVHAFERQAETDIRPEFLECWLQAADDSYRRHVAMLVPAAVDVLRDMGPAQVDHLQAELEERNRDYSERMRFGDPVEQREARIDRYVERIERWTESLDDSQVDWLALQLDRLPDVSSAWLDYRRQQQAGLLALLRAEAGAPDLQDYLEAWWLHFDNRAPGLERDTDLLRQGMVNLIAQLDGRLTTRQRQKLVAGFRDLRAGLQSASRRTDELADTRARIENCTSAAAI